MTLDLLIFPFYGLTCHCLLDKCPSNRREVVSHLSHRGFDLHLPPPISDVAHLFTHLLAIPMPVLDKISVRCLCLLLNQIAFLSLEVRELFIELYEFFVCLEQENLLRQRLCGHRPGVQEAASLFHHWLPAVQSISVCGDSPGSRLLSFPVLPVSGPKRRGHNGCRGAHRLRFFLGVLQFQVSAQIFDSVWS